jgi:hypothetical protein
MSSHRCIKSLSSRSQTNGKRDTFTNTTGAAAPESSATTSAVETEISTRTRTLELLRMICGLDISALIARHVGRRPSSRAVCHFGREDARRVSTRSVSLGQPIRPEEPPRAPARAYRRPPSALRASLRAAQAVPPAHRRTVLTDVQLADADRDPIS